MKNIHGGFATLYLILLMLFLLVSIAGSSFFLISVQQRVSRTTQNSLQAYWAGEAGVEDAIYRIKTLLPYAESYTVPVASTQTTVTVAALGTSRTVRAEGQERTSSRALETVLNVSTSSVSFFYGVHVGSSGLSMGNGSTVVGNVFSNGDISGSGDDQSTITGTAMVAGSSDIEDITIQGDAYANELENCTVGGIAHYFNDIDGCTATSTQQLLQQVEPEDFPVTQEQIDAWKAVALAGGTQGSMSLGNGSQLTIGPKKVDGSFSTGNSSTITIAGTVWVTGAFSMGNTAIVQLGSGYGVASGVLIIDGAVSFGNGVILRGSGQAGSKLLIVSLRTGTAFSLGNTGTGDIFYAPNGTITIGNGFIAEEVTGKGLIVGNSATITYESGLANENFSSGPGGAFEVQSWKEVE